MKYFFGLRRQSGIAGMLGMHELQKLADLIEHQIHSGSSENNMTNELIALSNANSSALQVIEAMGLKEKADSASIDMAKASEMVNDIVWLLEKNDMKAYTLWRELEPILTSVISENYVVSVRQDIENFDFPNALWTLNAIIEIHPKLIGLGCFSGSQNRFKTARLSIPWIVPAKLPNENGSSGASNTYQRIL